MMCSAMVASVPIPCESISPIRSDSVSGEGACEGAGEVRGGGSVEKAEGVRVA